MKSLKTLLVGLLALQIALGPLLAEVPILIPMQGQNTPAINGVQNLRVTGQSADGSEVILTMDYSFDGSGGSSARLLPIIADKKLQKVSSWFGADPVTIPVGHGIISVKVKFFNDEPGTPKNLTTDRVRIVMLTDGGNSSIAQNQFTKTIKWGEPPAGSVGEAAPAVNTPSAAQLKAAQEAAAAKARAAAAARQQAEEDQLAAEAKVKAEAEARALEEARQKAEQERLAAEAKAKAAAEAIETARLKAEQERIAAEAQAKAEAEARARAEAQRKADEERLAAKAKAEAEARAQEAARQKAEQDRLAAEAKAREEARLKAEQERIAAQARAEAEAKARAEAQRKAEEERLAAEAKAAAEAQAREQARLKAEQERLAAQAKAQEDARQQAEAEARAKAEQERLAAAAKAREEARLKAEQERVAAEAKAREEARLKAEQERLAAEAKVREEARLKAEQERLAAEQRAREEAAARLAAEAHLKAEQERLAAEAKAKAEQDRLAAEAKAKAEAEARALELAQQKAEQERIAAEAKAKAAAQALAAAQAKAEQDRLAAEAQAKTAALARARAEQEAAAAKIETPAAPASSSSFALNPNHRSKVNNIDIVRRSLDRSEMTLSVDYDFDKADGKVKMGIDVASTDDPAVATYFSSATADLSRGSHGCMIPVKLGEKAAEAIHSPTLPTDKVWVYLVNNAGEKSYIYQSTMVLRWHVPGGSRFAEAAAPAAPQNSVLIDTCKQNDLFGGYVIVKYNLAAASGRLRLRLYDSANPASAEWFATDEIQLKSGPGMQVMKASVLPAALSPDVFKIDTVEIQLVDDYGKLITSSQKEEPMTWAKRK